MILIIVAPPCCHSNTLIPCTHYSQTVHVQHPLRHEKKFTLTISFELIDT